jgi:hypothetical protein
MLWSFGYGDIAFPFCMVFHRCLVGVQSLDTFMEGVLRLESLRRVNYVCMIALALGSQVSAVLGHEHTPHHMTSWA